MEKSVKQLPSLGIARLLVAGCLVSGLSWAAAAEPQRAVPKNQAEIKQSFAPVVKRAAPAVVNVYVRHRVERLVSPFANDPFFSRLFGDKFGIPRERIQNSLGSGVIVSEDGIVVTNNHVIKGSGEAEITIALADGREFPAELVLEDEKTDLAVLRVDGDGVEFPSVAFNDSDTLQVGDLVLAIGDPFGVGQTVTSGIVSAVARTQVGISDYQFFIQTDAAINPGNSGGALVDMEGRLVGINTAIFSRSGGSHGIGFAIPSNMVRLVVQAALKGGKVQRPWFGASLQSVTSDIADSLGLDRPSGVLVKDIHAKGPAAQAGLRVGDVITSIDGKPIQDPHAFRYRLVTKGIGGSADLRLIRKGRTFTATLSLMAPVEDPPRDARRLSGRHPLAGCEVANLSPAVAEEIGMDIERHQGVVVLEVKSNTPAARMGVRRGDIIVSVNNAKVGSVEKLVTVLENSAGKWRLSVERGGRLFKFAIAGRARE